MSPEDSKLTPFSYVILALIGKGGAGPHDLARMMRTGSSIYWSAARSQYYAEPRRLEKLGYLTSETRPGQTTQRTHYTLTERGMSALTAWLPQPARFSRIQSEPVIKLLAADLVDDAQILHSVSALRAEIEEISTGLAEAEANAANLPARERYLRLNHQLGRALLNAHLEWLEKVETQLTHTASDP